MTRSKLEGGRRLFVFSRVKSFGSIDKEVSAIRVARLVPTAEPLDFFPRRSLARERSEVGPGSVDDAISGHSRAFLAPLMYASINTYNDSAKLTTGRVNRVSVSFARIRRRREISAVPSSARAKADSLSAKARRERHVGCDVIYSNCINYLRNIKRDDRD